VKKGQDVIQKLTDAYIGKADSQCQTKEKEILEMLSRGLTYKEIAEKVFISPQTVRKHVYHIYEKLHVSNRIEAVNAFYGR
jgi:DNA-binding NarL/FixJ family response regulator